MRSWHCRSDSMMPLMPSPGSPKTVSTPHSNRHSTMRSAAVAAMGTFPDLETESFEEQQDALPRQLQSSIEGTKERPKSSTDGGRQRCEHRLQSTPQR